LRVRVDSLIAGPTGRPGVHVSCPPAARPSPGQFALALAPGQVQAARTALFPTDIDDQGFTAGLPEGAASRPGVELDLWTPVGNGFTPPASARRWLLAAIGVTPERLLPLIDVGLARGAAIVLSAAGRPPDLAPAVEVVVDPIEALSWADYLAVDLVPEQAGDLRQRLGKFEWPTGRRSLAAQVLFTPSIACGLGVCGACAVEGRRLRLACIDGPVFELHDLGV